MSTFAAFSKPWADTPLALISTPIFITKTHDLFTSGASHMCMVHNSIFRGYNSIYHQASHVAAADMADFVGYCLTWHKFLKSHADNEDTSLFPNTMRILNDATIFDAAEREHDAFMPGLAKFQAYLVSLSSPSEFSGTTLLEIMATFQQPFELHMRNEVATIANLANHPKAPIVESDLEKATMAEFEKREGAAIQNSGMTDVLPFFLFNFDAEFEEGMWRDWPPIPWPIRWLILNIAKFKHPGWWKFASCNAERQRIPLYAFPDSEKAL